MNRAKNYKFSSEITQKLHELNRLDNYHVFFALVQDWGMIALAIFVSEYSFYLYPFSLIIIGSKQRALATILHESVHGTLAKNRKLNYIAGTYLSGYWILQDFFSYKQTHLELHHIYLGNKEKDPDFQYYIQSGLFDKDLNAKKFLLKHLLSVIFLLKVPSYLVYLIKNRMSSIKNNTRELQVMGICWSILILVLSYMDAFYSFFLYWIIPYCSVFMIIGYFIEIAEHYPLLLGKNDIIYMSRNRNSHFIESLFFSMHNENYHLLHHLRPSIPFWNIEKAHKIMMQDKIYSEVNKKFGGIFLSNNNNKSLMYEILNIYLK